MDNNKISGSCLKVTAFQIIFAIFCEEDFKINCGRLSVLVDIETDSMDMLWWWVMIFTPILKSLVFPVIWLALIGAIYSQIAPFFALNRIFFLAIEETTLKTKPPIRFQGLSKVTNQITGKWRIKSDKFCNFCFQNSYFFSSKNGATHSFNFEIMHMISAQIALHSVQLPLEIS